MMKSRAASAPFTVWMLLFTVVPLAVLIHGGVVCLYGRRGLLYL